MPFLQIVLAGAFGTAFMTVIMTLAKRVGWSNGDMVRAVGSLATRSLDGSVRAGLVIHLTSGILFAIPYTILLGIFAPDFGAIAVAIGFVLGVLHGILVSLLIIAFFSDKHPVEQFRGAGMEIAAAHIVGHAGYGFGVGLAYAALKIVWTI